MVLVNCNIKSLPAASSIVIKPDPLSSMASKYPARTLLIPLVCLFIYTILTSPLVELFNEIPPISGVVSSSVSRVKR